MATTIPMLAKGLEDLTEAYASNNKKIETVTGEYDSQIDSLNKGLNTVRQAIAAESKVREDEDNKERQERIKAIEETYTKQETDERIDSSISAIPLTKQDKLGLTKTTNRRPNINECKQNEPWSASPNWVFQLLMGTAQQDVNNQVSKALQDRVKSDKNIFCYRGSIPVANLDSVKTTGIYSVAFSSSTGCLLVFSPYGSTGIIQFYKAGYNGSTPWQYRNAIDSDTNRWTEWRTFLSQDNFKLTGTTLEITI